MKSPLIIFSIVTFAGCMQSNKSNAEQPNSVNFEKKDKVIMDENIIKLKPGESRDLFIPSRGAVPIRLVVEITPKQIAQVERQELPEERIPKNIKPGDLLPAYYVLKAKEAGKGEIEFFEQPLGAPESSRLSVKKYMIIVE